MIKRLLCALKKLLYKRIERNFKNRYILMILIEFRVIIILGRCDWLIEGTFNENFFFNWSLLFFIGELRAYGFF